jgi:hypothetical protein
MARLSVSLQLFPGLISIRAARRVIYPLEASYYPIVS